MISKPDFVRKIQEAAPGGGYIAGSSNTIPDSVPLENYKTMLETTLKYGKYPLLS
jgi:uroporphyrinogen decarboxylase